MSLSRQYPVGVLVLSCVLLTMQTGTSQSAPITPEQRIVTTATMQQIYTSPITIGFRNYLPDHRMLRGIQERVLLSCARLWAENSGLVFTFVGGPVTEHNATILISYEEITSNPRVFEDGSIHTDPQLGRATYPGIITEPLYYSQLHLNVNTEWRACFTSTSRGLHTKSYQFVMCHELGHPLGFNHTKNSNSIMKERYEEQLDDVTLGQEDIDKVIALYGPSNGKVFEGGVKPRPVPPHIASEHRCIERELEHNATARIDTIQSGPTTLTMTTNTNNRGPSNKRLSTTNIAIKPLAAVITGRRARRCATRRLQTHRRSGKNNRICGQRIRRRGRRRQKVVNRRRPRTQRQARRER